MVYYQSIHIRSPDDELVKPKYNMDWEGLRKRVKERGLRHSTLTAQMPSEI